MHQKLTAQVTVIVSKVLWQFSDAANSSGAEGAIGGKKDSKIVADFAGMYEVVHFKDTHILSSS